MAREAKVVLRKGQVFSLLSLIVFATLAILISVNQDESQWNTASQSGVQVGELSWVLYACALVLLMTPGVVFFYAGLVRSKNLNTTMLLGLVTIGVISFLWIIIGFSLAFGDNSLGGLIGSPASFSFFRHVGVASHGLAPTIPLGLFALFQLMFAIVTATIITGSFVERINTAGYVLFLILWHVVVYCPMAHMVWHPQGLIHSFKVIDFAGGMVVHIASGFTALMGGIFLGASKVPATTSKSNIPFVILGTTFLWFGWFGFNGGSAVVGTDSGTSGYLAVLACLNTVLAAGTSMLSWLSMESVLNKAGLEAKEACFGVVVGLVAVTPAAGYINVGGACCLGLISGSSCKFAQYSLRGLSYIEDNMDVFACHGVGGIVGVVCTALFATTSVNPGGENGLFYGSGTLFWRSLVTILLVVSYVCAASYACYWLANALIPLRVAVELEVLGLDTAHTLDSSVVLKHSNIHDILAVLDASRHGGIPEGAASKPRNTMDSAATAPVLPVLPDTSQYCLDIRPEFSAPLPITALHNNPPLIRAGSLASRVEAPVVR